MTDNFKKHLDLNIYQIYPRSFCDSNNDGIGDLKGVISKLDYLCELGVNAIWLCPCFNSPNEDNGYDVADYCDIMDEFGTMDDMKTLIAEMHKRGMKIILDLVPNHTSTAHKWFQESRKSKDNPYSNYYYWFDNPPNHWQSCFGGTAYQFDEVRGQYYLHSYAVGQADLNWENPKVVEEMQNVVDFWVDLGADGFRIDVIDQISKDFVAGKNCFGPHLHEYINALFGRKHVRHIFTVGECWCDDIDEILKHCAEERGELVTLFQFAHHAAGRSGKWNPSSEKALPMVRDILTKWQTLTAQHDLIHALFTDNHDNSFFLSRVADDQELRYESATMLATMFYLLRGTTFIYQGQEFGSTASRFQNLEDFRDVESLNYYHHRIGEAGQSHEKLIQELNFGSRDNTRRPFAWNGDKYCGFSEAEPWIMPPSRHEEINLETDRDADKSIFRFYQKVLALRSASETIRYGGFRPLHKETDPFFMYERALGEERYIVICNFDEASEIDMPAGQLILSNYSRTNTDGVTFRPYETAVYRLL